MPSSITPSSLKRPRSTSQPPSPSSSSSPKRAASEDPFGSSSEYESTRSDLLVPNTNMTQSQLGTNGSSPLRLDVDGSGDEGGGEWVTRTSQVRIDSSEAGDLEGDGDTTVREDEQDVWKERYSELLATLPPPFVINETYYILPKSTLSSIQTLALGDADDDPAPKSKKDAEGGGLLESAVNELVPDKSAETFWVIQSTGEGAEATLVGEARQERVWALGDKEENVDFVFVSKAGWEKVAQWFGPYDGPSLPRYCVPPDNIEIRPPTLRLFIILPNGITHSTTSPQNDEALQVELMCPSTTPMPIFQQFVRSVASQKVGSTIEASWPTRLWIVAQSGENDEKLLSAGALVVPSSTLVATGSKLVPPSDCAEDRINLAEAVLGGSKSQIVAIEFGKKEAGTEVWNVEQTLEGIAKEKALAPLFSKGAFYSGSGSAINTNNDAGESSSSSSGMQTRSQTRQGEGKGKGLVGLQNLGNTCFMNSAVQCLSNTQELSEYFLSGVYKEELNRDNPLGMHGQIAEAFGGVIKSLWAPNVSGYASHSPRDLKWTTSKFAPQFAGYGQHDTQEFIAFLLDGLHEDLNRIIKKPYIEKPDWKAGGGDKQLAELGKECWDGYKKRNDSVIVDLFQGQLQSTLVCPECHKESITMDPFMYLTVPLPVAQHRLFKLTYVPRDAEQPPVKMRLLISQNASFMQIKEKIGALMQAEPSNLLGFDLWKGAPYAWWLDGAHNSDCKDSDEAIFYELDAKVTSNHKVTGASSSDGSFTVPVYSFKMHEYRNSRSNDFPQENAMKPFFIKLTKAEACDPNAVREAIWHGYSRFIRDDYRDQIHVPASSQASVSAPVTSTAKSEDGDSVTEIHLNGDHTTVVEVPSVRGETLMDVDSNHVTAPNPGGLHPSASSVSLASQGSTSRSISGSASGQIVPRSDIFKVYVADPSGDYKSPGLFRSKEKGKDKTSNPVLQFYQKNPSAASASWSLLEARKKKAKKHIVNRLASGISSIVSAGYGSEGEASDSSSVPEEQHASTPVVRPGEGIFCQWTANEMHDWLDIELMGDEIVDPAIAKENAKKKEGKSISIEDCLDEFSKEETLGQDDLWYCPVCKKHQAATKKLEIYKAPDILVICIKRFGSSRRMGDKLDNLVDFPIDGLDLEERIGERKVAKTLKLGKEQADEFGIEAEGESMLYDLYAVDNHFGGMGGGHYTAFCRNRVDGQWYNYDDSRVSKADEASVHSRAAYLLFYRRRTERPIGGISRIKAEQASRAVTPIPGNHNDNTDVDNESTINPTMMTALPTSTSDSEDELPSYSSQSSPAGSPPLPSPTLSVNGDGDDESDVPRIRVEDISSAFPSRGSGLGAGFGTANWTTSTQSSSVVHHPFASSGNGISSITPPASDHEEEEEGDVIKPDIKLD